jgi:ABC-type Na+ efflux pump permease subunit
MESSTLSAPISRNRLWAGRIISALSVLFLLFDAVIHIIRIGPVDQGFADLGWPTSLSPTLGIIELICVVLYVIPRMSVLGAVLLTGYLGGAVATNLRVGLPLFSHVLFPVYVGVLLWGGLYLRDLRLRSVFPIRS